MTDSKNSLNARRWFRISGDMRLVVVDKVVDTNVHPSRILSEWVLVLVTSGERTFSVGSENYVIGNNEFFILPPNEPHFGLRLDKHQAYFAHFFADGQEVSPPTRIHPGEILLPLHGEIPLELHCIDIMDYAVRHRTPPFFSEPFIISQITAILYQLSIDMQKSVLWTKQEGIRANDILKYIDDNIGRPIHSQDYAKAFGKSYRQLNNVFGRVYGMTIKQMQINLRVDLAKRMLSLGKSIAEVSAECGFEDYLYFLKVFKAKTGMSPSEYIDRFNFVSDG